MSNIRKISATGLSLIKRFEGCHKIAYWDMNAYSIGYGHHNGAIKKGEICTQEQADKWLAEDCAKFEAVVNELPYEFTQNEFDALVSFCYNCGAGNLRNLCKYGNRNKAEIAEHMTAYNKAGGKVLAGLTKRRQAEKDLFVSDQTMETMVYFPKYTGDSDRIDKVFTSIGADKYYTRAKSYTKRAKVATVNGITSYKGSAEQNLALIAKAKEGVLVMP